MTIESCQCVGLIENCLEVSIIWKKYKVLPLKKIGYNTLKLQYLESVYYVAQTAYYGFCSVGWISYKNIFSKIGLTWFHISDIS